MKGAEPSLEPELVVPEQARRELLGLSMWNMSALGHGLTIDFRNHLPQSLNG